MISRVLSVPPQAAQAESLRQVLASSSRKSQRGHAAALLGAEVGTWLATHRRAPLFFVDVEPGSSSQLWQREWDPLAAGTPLSTLHGPAARVASLALAELFPSVGAYRRAAAVATLCGDDQEALRITDHGLRRLHPRANFDALILSRAFSSMRLGRIGESLRCYRLVAANGTPEERCNALFSGALIAADCGLFMSMRWFLDRARDEEPIMNERWKSAITRTRARREGKDATKKLLLLLGES
ncbi:hypothetical protein Poly30_06590 [Planctomycetes bacterium Poly30]|uniref:Tetratricopeptide repeat protein n=1 Tax=Saltatorellus ferox TaxID=2528018 RepID=A0A518EM59_9BACT|nr:hypothetical protein Poly30_06590 [Planctomycetes bacterium Poly30]